uniref:uncharacterized protein C12orf56-like isoform X1 n=1 Tax=Styela clava TaxID=7725 RepID=UPI00193A1C06|nr:uncharacterized protein C12orf56-like isoform X1 [Styela clava]
MSVKYAKFDSFLKRILSNKEYKEVKTYEPCVVTSSKEKHAFRFTFITRNRIYITENPPKSLLYSVELKDVVDIFVVNDKANFLQADLRDRVEHVVVKHISQDGNNSNDTFDNSHLMPESSGNAGSSSSTENPTPLLCSYLNVGSVADSHSVSSEPQALSDFDDNMNEVPTQKNKKNANSSRTKRLSGSSRWESKDPYYVQVMLPNAVMSSSQNLEELHIYILSENTTYFRMLQSVWRNYIVYHSSSQRQEQVQSTLNSTLQYDELDRATSDKSASMDESTKSLFADLKQELQMAQNIEMLYGLYKELKTAVTQDILIKHLFWKDDILFKKSIDLINRYIKQSVSVNIDERADEIELAIIVLHTVAIMIRESEAIPRCYRVLQNLSLPQFKDIIESLLCMPKLLCDSWLCNDDIKSMVAESTVASCEVLYEIIIASQQVSWIVTGKSTVFGRTVLFATINESERLHGFLDRLIHSCIKLWDSKEMKSTKYKKRHQLLGTEVFSPENAVKAFHLFTVFHRIIVRSPTAAQHVRSSFREEFKYYINPSSVSAKFPQEYPISAMARSVVHAVGSYVTAI